MMEWGCEEILEQLGIARQNHRPYSKKTLHLDKGEIDPRSGGGLAIVATGEFTDKKIIKNLDTRYWVIYPDGRFEIQNLFEFSFKAGKKDKVSLDSLYLLGREISLSDSRHVDNVCEAARRIHIDLRRIEGTLPHVSEIFKDCRLEDIAGEHLPLPGFNLKHRILFPISPYFNATAGKKKVDLIFPLEAIRPLLGVRKNTIDPDHSYLGSGKIRARSVLPQVGRKFEISSSLEKRKDIKNDINERVLQIDQREIDVPESSKTNRELAHAKWDVVVHKKNPKASLAVLKRLRLMQRNMMGEGFRDVMTAFGVIQRAHDDMLKSRDYPRLLDHLATYGHLNLVTTSSAPPPPKGRLILTSMGGNNVRAICHGIGEDIGGNCKVVEVEWYKRGEGIRKVGAIFDLGAYIIKNPKDWTGGGPDIVEKLKTAFHIFISHHHLDHLDFIIPYIKRGLITSEHTLYMTPDVWEIASMKLNKWGIKKHDLRMPKLHFLEEAGVIDIKDKQNVIRLSIAYDVNAVPHSAKDTPFIAYGRHGNTILGSYWYMGDMRYDIKWFNEHPGQIWSPVQLMKRHHQDLNEKELVPTYVELDGTSVLRAGRSVPEHQVEDNLVHILNNWCSDLHAGIAMIGTNDGRRETGLRVANRTGRNATAFGASVKKIFAVANKCGVNRYRCPPPKEGKFTGIKDYLAHHAQEIGVQPTTFSGHTSGKVKDWFQNAKPGQLLAFFSGSQGNDVEKESMTYRLADGTSYFDADPATSSTARPTHLSDWVIIFSQSAIPGNSSYQKTLIKRLAKRGAVVIESLNDDIQIHNPTHIAKRIINDPLLRLSYEYDTDGSLIVRDFPIHASGHGKNEDFRLWLNKLQARYYGIHHTDDREAVQAGYEAIEEEGKRHPGDIFENGTEVLITKDQVLPIGRTHTSVILTREFSEDGKHHNKRLEAIRFVNYDERSPCHDLGLLGKTGGPHEVAFGMQEEEKQPSRAMGNGSATSLSGVCVVKPPRQHKRPVFLAPAVTLGQLKGGTLCV